MVQWLRRLASTAGGVGSIPGTKIPQAKKKKEVHTEPLTLSSCI